MKEQKSFNLKIFLMPVVLLALVITCSFFYQSSMATSLPDDVVNNSKSVYDKIPNMDVVMKNGIITVMATSKAAEPDITIRYETLGFGVSTSKSKSKSLKKNGVNYKGYSAPSNVGVFWLNDSHKVKSETEDGYNTSTFEFPAEEVNRILGDKLPYITNETKIYLNAVFRSYRLTPSGKVTRKNNITSWEEMMNAEHWSKGSLEGFAKYYNMELTFSPGKQPNSLYYDFDGEKIFVEELDTKFINERLDWNRKVESETIHDDKPYSLIGYEVRGKLYNQVIISEMYHGEDDDTIFQQVTSEAQASVPLGGLDIIIKYIEKTDEEKEPDPDPPGDDEPTPTPSPTKPPDDPGEKPTIPPIDIPKGEVKQKSLDSLYANGHIRADNRGAERFNASHAIPTTESLYTQVFATEYATSYYFNKKVIVKDYPVTVSKTFTLTWTDSSGSQEEITEDVVIKQTIPVQRACAYWEIIHFDYFTIDKASLYNKALPGGSSTIYPNLGHYHTPNLVISKSNNENYHIIPPPQAQEGYEIILEGESIRGEGEKPTIPRQDFTYEANIMTGECLVRNDYLSFGGVVVMDNRLYEKEAPSLSHLSVLQTNYNKTQGDVLYKSNQIIESSLPNGVYQSSGTLRYKNHPSAIKSYGNYYDISIRGLNQVTVHTPVLCDASLLTEDPANNINSNDLYVQALDIDEECVQLVLDRDSSLSDFTVKVSNYGNHISNSGYNTRDFAWGLRDPNVSYIAMKDGVLRNEVKFPFDVFYKKPKGDDEYIKKNTWICFGLTTPSFYLPMWVDEGIYTVEFRTIAVNGESHLDKEQTYANTMRSNYVAKDSIRVQVSGRLYGLTIYDVSDYPTWEDVFRVERGSTDLKSNKGYPNGVTKEDYNKNYSYDYTVGVADQYGKTTGRLAKYTLPLVNGSHPFITNAGILKTGYGVRFKINTIGNNFSPGDSVLIKPRFYYVDGKGENRMEVDLYYNEAFNNKNNKLVKVGSALDLTNIKSYRCGNNYLAIPDYNLSIMADLNNVSLQKYKWRRTQLFTYNNIRIQSPLMVYSNTDYLLNLKSSSIYNQIREAGISDLDIISRIQTYYGEYFLPSDLKAVEKGFDVYGYAARYGISSNEVFWLRDGYLIINFDIVTTDHMGEENLSYLNQDKADSGYCSMWSLEQAVSYKESYNGPAGKLVEFNLHPGDFMVYYIDQSIIEDYQTYLTR